MKGLVIALTLWVAQTSGLPLAEPPIVRMASAEEIHRSVSLTDPTTAVVAFYHEPTRTIWMPQRLTYDPVWLSILAHEIHHHLAARAGIVYPCRGAGEAAAYATQASYLALDGRSLRDVGLDPARLAALTSCAGGR